MHQRYIYKPKGTMTATVCLSIMFLLFSVGPYITGGLLLFFGYMIFYIMAVYFIFRRKVILYENSILIVQGFRKKLLNYNDICIMKIEKHGMALSKVSYPAITFYDNSKSKFLAYLYHCTYRKEDIAVIVDFIKNKNANIDIKQEIIEYLK